MLTAQQSPEDHLRIYMGGPQVSESEPGILFFKSSSGDSNVQSALRTTESPTGTSRCPEPPTGGRAARRWVTGDSSPGSYEKLLNPYLL